MQYSLTTLDFQKQAAPKGELALLRAVTDPGLAPLKSRAYLDDVVDVEARVRAPPHTPTAHLLYEEVAKLATFQYQPGMVINTKA